jgi:hypothetical protein
VNFGKLAKVVETVLEVILAVLQKAGVAMPGTPVISTEAKVAAEMITVGYGLTTSDGVHITGGQPDIAAQENLMNHHR